MPTYHLMLPFLVMIFGVSIKLETDHNKQRYGYVVHKEKSIELDYIMTKENLREIFSLRPKFEIRANSRTPGSFVGFRIKCDRKRLNNG